MNGGKLGFRGAVLCAGLTLFSMKASATDVAMLMSKDLPEYVDKVGQMLTVEYAPGESSDKHKHEAHIFVYVLSGSVVMQVEGGEEQLLSVGDTFYENPSDIHTVSRNASATESAKILVFTIKSENAPVTIPVSD